MIKKKEKQKYEPPLVISINDSHTVQGARCAIGQSATNACQTGAVAITSCGSGARAGAACSTGTAPFS